MLGWSCFINITSVITLTRVAISITSKRRTLCGILWGKNNCIGLWCTRNYNTIVSIISMVSWYSDSEIAYSIHCQTIWTTIYLDVDLCVTEEAKSVCSQYLYLLKTLWCLFQKLTTEMNRSCKVHSAWKHNISGLLEKIEIHKYTSQRHWSMKSIYTAFLYKCVLFCPFRIKLGLKFRHVNVMILCSQHMEACLRF